MLDFGQSKETVSGHRMQLQLPLEQVGGWRTGEGEWMPLPQSRFLCAKARHDPCVYNCEPACVVYTFRRDPCTHPFCRLKYLCLFVRQGDISSLLLLDFRRGRGRWFVDNHPSLRVWRTCRVVEAAETDSPR